MAAKMKYHRQRKRHGENEMAKKIMQLESWRRKIVSRQRNAENGEIALKRNQKEERRRNQKSMKNNAMRNKSIVNNAA